MYAATTTVVPQVLPGIIVRGSSKTHEIFQNLRSPLTDRNAKLSIDVISINS